MSPVADRAREALDLFQFSVPPGAEGRQRLRTILRAHLAHQSAKMLRRFLVHVLAGLGAVVVVCVLASGIMSVQGYQSLIAVWSVCLLSVIGAAAVEWSLRRRESRLIAEEDDDDPWRAATDEP